MELVVLIINLKLCIKTTFKRLKNNLAAEAYKLQLYLIIVTF